MGIKPVGIKHRSKVPTYANWQNGLCEETIGTRVQSPGNVGILTGSISGWIVDIDLDCAEAVSLAPSFLPATTTFGRQSKRRSHYLYQVDGDVKTKKFATPGAGDMLVELRADGCQTMAPPSYHPSGEKVEFDSFGSVTVVAAADLYTKVSRLAAATLIVRTWPEQGSRHNAALALAGVLTAAGLSLEEVEDFVEAVAEVADDEEYQARRASCKRTVERYLEGEPVTQLRHLAEIIGEPSARQFAEWIGLRRRGENDQHEARHRYELLLSKIERDRETTAIYRAAPTLALLSASDYAEAKVRLKALCPELNCNDLEKAVNEARRSRPAQDLASDRPVIEIGTRKPKFEVVREAKALLARQAECPSLFSRSGQLVRVRQGLEEAAVVEPLSREALDYELVRRADFVKPTRDGHIQVDPPKQLSGWLLSDPEPTLPTLNRIIFAPGILPDGSVIDRPGYHPDAKILFVPADPTSVPVIPERPTTQEIASAKSLLLNDLLGDFPFADEASRANALAYLFTLFLPPEMIGVPPLLAVTANMPGTGKTKLANVAARVATGRPAIAMALPDSDDEMRKQITSVLLRGSRVVLFDNISRTLRSPALEALLTSEMWGDRLLGQSRQLSLRNDAAWVVTGNNLIVSGDLQRRYYEVRIDAKHTRPWERSHFKHPNLEGWIDQNRGILIGAVLTLCRAYFAAERPLADVPTFGSFERWTKALGGILAYAGVEGFLQNLPRFGECEENEVWGQFLTQIHIWSEGREFQVRDLVQDISQGPFSKRHPALFESLPLYLVSASEKEGDLAQRLGYEFKRRSERPYTVSGHRLVPGGVSNGSRRWKVDTYNSGGDLAEAA